MAVITSLYVAVVRERACVTRKAASVFPQLNLRGSTHSGVSFHSKLNSFLSFDFLTQVSSLFLNIFVFSALDRRLLKDSAFKIKAFIRLRYRRRL